MEIDLHGYHPQEIVWNGKLTRIVQQAWEMGERVLNSSMDTRVIEVSHRVLLTPIPDFSGSKFVRPSAMTYN